MAAMTDTTQAKPKPLKLTAPRVSEKAEQNNAVALLRHCGFLVLELGQKRLPVACRSCRTMNWPTFTDSTASTPDIAVLCPRWARHVLMLEFKGPGTPIRAGQQALVNAGVSGIVHNAAEAARDVIAFETSLGLTPNRALVAWLEQSGERG